MLRKKVNETNSSFEIAKPLPSTEKLMKDHNFTPTEILEISNNKENPEEMLLILSETFYTLSTKLMLSKEQILKLINNCRSRNDLRIFAKNAAELRNFSLEELIIISNNSDLKKDLSVLLKIINQLIHKSVVISFLKEKSCHKDLHHILLTIIKQQSILTLEDISFLNHENLKETDKNTGDLNPQSTPESMESVENQPVSTKRSENPASTAVNPKQVLPNPTFSRFKRVRTKGMKPIKEIDMDIVNALVQFGYAKDKVIDYVQRNNISVGVGELNFLYKNFEHIKSVVPRGGSIHAMVVLAEKWDTLINKHGYLQSEVFDIMHRIGGGNNLMAVAELHDELIKFEIKGIKLEKKNIIKVVKNRGGSSNLEALKEHFPTLKDKFSLKQIIKILDHPGGSKGLTIVAQNFAYLETSFGFTADEITMIAGVEGGYENMVVTIKVAPILKDPKVILKEFLENKGKSLIARGNLEAMAKQISEGQQSNAVSTNASTLPTTTTHPDPKSQSLAPTPTMQHPKSQSLAPTPTMEPPSAISNLKSFDLMSVQKSTPTLNTTKEIGVSIGQKLTDKQKLLSLGFASETAQLIIRKSEFPKLMEQLNPHYEMLIEEFHPAQTVLASVVKVGIENIIALAKYFKILKSNFHRNEILDIASDVEGAASLEIIATNYQKLTEKKINNQTISKNHIFRIMRRNGSKNIVALLKNRDQLDSYGFKLDQIASILEQSKGDMNLIAIAINYPNLKPMITTPAEMTQFALRTDAHIFITLASQILPKLANKKIDYSRVLDILMISKTPEKAAESIFQLPGNEVTRETSKRKEMEQDNMKVVSEPSIVISNQGDPKRHKTTDSSVGSASITSMNSPSFERQNEPTSHDKVFGQLINLGFDDDQAKEFVQKNMEIINKYLIPRYDSLIEAFYPAELLLREVAKRGLKEFAGFALFHKKFLNIDFDCYQIISIANNNSSPLTFDYLYNHYASLSNITIQNDKITNAELTLIASHDEGYQHLKAFIENYKFLADRGFLLPHIVNLLNHPNATITIKAVKDNLTELKEFFNPQQISIIAGRFEGDQNILTALKAAKLSYPVDSLVNIFMEDEDSKVVRDSLVLWIEQNSIFENMGSPTISTSGYSFYQNRQLTTTQSNDMEFMNLDLLDEQNLF